MEKICFGNIRGELRQFFLQYLLRNIVVPKSICKNNEYGEQLFDEKYQFAQEIYADLMNIANELYTLMCIVCSALDKVTAVGVARGNAKIMVPTATNFTNDDVVGF